MKYADIIVPKGKSNTVGIDFIISNLRIRIPTADFEEVLSQRETEDFQEFEQSPLAVLNKRHSLDEQP